LKTGGASRKKRRNVNLEANTYKSIYQNSKYHVIHEPSKIEDGCMSVLLNE
jgi:hypothetical protein